MGELGVNGYGKNDQFLDQVHNQFLPISPTYSSPFLTKINIFTHDK